MQNRFARFAVVVLAVLLAIIALQPYAERLLFSATTPRAVEPRGQLADSERSTIESSSMPRRRSCRWSAARRQPASR